jgi:hypothetical protein
MLRKEDGSRREVIVDHIIDASGSEPNVEVAQKSGLEIDKVKFKHLLLNIIFSQMAVLSWILACMHVLTSLLLAMLALSLI